MNIKKHACVECGGWNGHHFTNCPETPEQNEPDIAECACLGGLLSLPPAIQIIEDAHLRMMAAWRDLMEWEQLATNTRKALREAGKDPDCEPYCPSQAGINRTLMVRLEIGVAAQKLRRLLPNQNA